MMTPICNLELRTADRIFDEYPVLQVAERYKWYPSGDSRRQTTDGALLSNYVIDLEWPLRDALGAPWLTRPLGEMRL